MTRGKNIRNNTPSTLHLWHLKPPLYVRAVGSVPISLRVYNLPTATHYHYERPGKIGNNQSTNSIYTFFISIYHLPPG